jgi:hypothetical protein
MARPRMPSSAGMRLEAEAGRNRGWAVISFATLATVSVAGFRLFMFGPAGLSGAAGGFLALLGGHLPRRRLAALLAEPRKILANLSLCCHGPT